jgi:uncharacterized membrane protein
MAVVIFGGAVYLYRHGQSIMDYSTFKGQPKLTSNFRAILEGVITFRGRAIIQLGILLLIATPIARIVYSAIGFIAEKDYLYLGIALIVLAIIMASMLGGFGG